MLQTVDSSVLGKVYKRRGDWSHKGNFGKLLIIGGSKRYSGSPALAALAAIRSGVDLTTILAPRRAADIAASFSPDLITHPLDGDYFVKKHVKTALNMAGEHDAVVIGGGLERKPEILSAIESFLKDNDKPCVIDADAIYAVKKMKKLRENHIITPHPHEFFELMQKDPVYDHEERVRQAGDLALKKSCTILLKGAFDVITDGKINFVNTTGNPHMTKGGTGDTLAGICGSLLARGANTIDAGCAAAFINGVAGDLASRKFGEGLMASHLIEEINHIVK